MPFIEQALGEARESQNVPEAMYPLRIEKVDRVKSERTGREGTRCTIVITQEVEDVPNPRPIWYTAWDAMQGDDDSKVATMTLMNRRFFDMFEVAYQADGYDTDDLAGATCETLVLLETYKDDNGRERERNVVEPPPLSEEEEKPRRGRR